MNSYQVHATEGASGLELVIALYDGIIRFMFRAVDAVAAGDTRQRRLAVKRALDIVIHLQATLRMDVGGEPAKALSEFYAVIFALMLQGSQADSKEKFLRVITLVRNVRDAWRQVSNDPEAIQRSSSLRAGAVPVEGPYRERGDASARPGSGGEGFAEETAVSAGSNWTA